LALHAHVLRRRRACQANAREDLTPSRRLGDIATELALGASGIVSQPDLDDSILPPGNLSGDEPSIDNHTDKQLADGAMKQCGDAGCIELWRSAAVRSERGSTA